MQHSTPALGTSFKARVLQINRLQHFFKLLGV
jgi:hypothetical protein